MDELRTLAAETGWVEFKQGNVDPQRMGRTASALANSARLADQPFGYLVWGIEDRSHAIVGTSFDATTERKGNENLEFWLAKALDPSPAMTFRAVRHAGGRVVLLEIPAASMAPVRFEGRAYVRIGDATPLLSDFPEKERLLWSRLQPLIWEASAAADFVTSDEVVELLDYPAYFKLTKQRLPEGRNGVLRALMADGLAIRDISDKWTITNLGAVLFASDLRQFPGLARKSIRIIQYSGSNKVAKAREHNLTQGYASGFEELINLVNGLLPSNEHLGKAFREEMPVYPEIAIREIVANALMHQDMTMRGTGPTIELYADRMEITNPGSPLVDIRRFIGTPPRSRNEAMASLMRRMSMCEERGSGIVKIIDAAEVYQLPAPDFRVPSQSVQVVLFAPRNFREMDAAERLRACYQHASLRYLTGGRMTNSSFRERLGIADQNAAQVSRIIKQALAAHLIRPADPESPRGGYIPHDA